jgi:hypothetical protein
MNKKIILSLVAIAVIIPVLGITMLPDNDDADKIGKEFAANNPGVTIYTSSSEEQISEQEEVNRAQLIIEGIILEEKPFWKIDQGDKLPYILTEYVVKVNNVIKGNVSVDQTVNVLMRGGTLDGITSYNESLDIESGDNVILLLGQDFNSVWGGYYFPISATKSTYSVDDDLAKNYLESKNMDKTLLKEKLERLAGQ